MITDAIKKSTRKEQAINRIVLNVHAMPNHVLQNYMKFRKCSTLDKSVIVFMLKKEWLLTQREDLRVQLDPVVEYRVLCLPT